MNKIERRKYIKKWGTEHKENLKRTQFKYNYSFSGVYKKLKWTSRFRKIPLLMTKEEFVIWNSRVKRKCHYCEIPEELSVKMKWGNKIIHRLSIDRIDNKKGYILSNIVLSCLRCNGIKSDFFTEKEMIEIGKKFVKPKWKYEH